jgi:hypothetical protein
MLELRTPVVLQLQNGELLRWRQRRAVWLSVVRGRVWVTRALDPDDHFLDAGQSMHLPAGARAIVSAEGAAQVAMSQEPSWLGALLRGVATGIATGTQWATRRSLLPPWISPPIN